jgi:hypothetical protein
LPELKVSIFVAAASVIACTHRPIYVEPSPNGVVLTGGKLGMYHKEVMTKKDPDTLVAPDATICRVAPDVYKSAALHSVIYCNWQ